MKKWQPETKNKGIFDNTQLIPSSRKSALDPGIQNPWIRKKVIPDPHTRIRIKLSKWQRIPDQQNWILSKVCSMKNKVDKGQHYQCQQPLRGLFVRNKVLRHEGETEIIW